MITAFVPCRAGSRRVPGKNTRPFAEHEHGLLGIKLEQLGQVDSIDQIVVSSNDQQVLSIASDLAGFISKPVRVIERPDSLSVDDCLDDLIRYVGDLIDDGHVLWTHVTSPFFDAPCYQKIISSYLAALENGGFDCAISVDEHQTFVYRRGLIDSHDTALKKWPRTHDIEPYYLVNSAAFLISSEHMRKFNDRVGNKPALVVTPQMRGYDIDTPEQFEFAEVLMASGVLTSRRSDYEQCGGD